MASRPVVVPIIGDAAELNRTIQRSESLLRHMATTAEEAGVKAGAGMSHFGTKAEQSAAKVKLAQKAIGQFTPRTFGGVAAGSAEFKMLGDKAGLAGGAIGAAAGAVIGLGSAFMVIKKSVETTTSLYVETDKLHRLFGLTWQQSQNWAAASDVLGISQQKLAMSFTTLSKAIKAINAGHSVQTDRIKALDRAQQQLNMRKKEANLVDTRHFTTLQAASNAMTRHRDLLKNLSLQQQKLNAERRKAGTSGNVAQDLKLLGLTSADIQAGAKPAGFQSLLEKVGAGIKRLPQGTNASPIVRDLFGGRGGSDILRILGNQDATLGAAQQFLPKIDGKSVKNIKQLHDYELQAKFASLGLQMELTKVLMPALLKLGSLVDWTSRHQGTLNKILRVTGDVLTIIATPIRAVITLFRVVGDLVHGRVSKAFQDIAKFWTGAFTAALDALGIKTGWLGGVFRAIGNVIQGVVHGIGGVIHTVFGAAVSVVNALGSAFKSLGSIISKVASSVSHPLKSLGGLIGGIGGFLGIGGGKGGPSGKAGAAPKGQVTSWLTTALKATGHYSAANLNALYGRTMQESGGDPRSQNNWDSNAKAGHPSKGLLQTIDSTFSKYAMKGHGNIWNPIDNAIAAIRYMYATYGHIVGPGSGGYARGGMVTSPGYFAGEEAPRYPEFIISTNPRDHARMLPLVNAAAAALGAQAFASGGYYDINGHYHASAPKKKGSSKGPTAKQISAQHDATVRTKIDQIDALLNTNSISVTDAIKRLQSLLKLPMSAAVRKSLTGRIATLKKQNTTAAKNAADQALQLSDIMDQLEAVGGGQLTQDAMAVRTAQRHLKFAKRYGSKVDIAQAQLDLANAQQQQKDDALQASTDATNSLVDALTTLHQDMQAAQQQATATHNISTAELNQALMDMISKQLGGRQAAFMRSSSPKALYA